MLLARIKDAFIDFDRDVIERKCDDARIIYINPKNYKYFRGRNASLRCITGVTFDGILCGILFGLLIRGYPTKSESFNMSSIGKKLFTYCESTRKTVFVCGGSEEEIETFCAKVALQYRDLKIVGRSHGYVEDDEIAERIKRLKPQCIVVGLGAIRQERFIDNLDINFESIVISCGACISQVSLVEGLRYFPAFFESFGLRWLYRVFKEPAVLLRIIREYPTFLLFFALDAVKYLLSGRARVKSGDSDVIS